MLHAVIDMGSNSVRLMVFDVTVLKEGSLDIKTIWNKKIMAGLISYVEDGRLTQAGIDRAVNALDRHMEAASSMNLTTISVFATAILRNIENSKEALEQIQRKAHVKIDLLSAKDEAHLGYRGCQNQVGPGRGVLVDMGGGSTEISTTSDGSEIDSTSLTFGSLNLYLGYVSDILPTRGEQEKIRAFVTKEIEKAELFDDEPYPKMLALGGSARASVKLANALSGDTDVNSATREQLEGIISNLAIDYKGTLNMILKTCPDRVHTVVPGLVAITTLMDMVNAIEVNVTKHGLREGYLIERVLMRK